MMAWGLGYFGMPHILVRFMAIRDENELKLSRRIAAVWVVLSMGVRPQPGKTIEQLCQEQMGIADLDKIVETSAIEVLVPRALDRRNLVPAFPPKATPATKFERGKKFSFTLSVTVKPTYELSSYDPVEVTVQPFVFDESPIEKQMEELAEDTSVVFISHGDCEADARELAEMIQAKHKVDKLVISYVGPVIGNHSGPGTLALFFQGKHK